jgi:vacuolar-type H+-ATPase subunit H
MVKPNQPDELLPLDQIRLSEAEITRRVAVAREVADKKINQAKLDADLIKKRGREKGEQRGQALYQENITNAIEEAREINAKAIKKAEAIRAIGKQQMTQAVTEAIALILNLEKREKPR